jgi:hypothetical protein
MRAFALLCIILLSFGAYAAERAVVRMPESAGDMYSSSHALIIGVWDYTGGWPKLPGVKQDTDAVAAALTAQGFNVRRSVNPTSQEIKVAVDDFISRYADDERARILIYFAGHGHTLDGTGYIVGRDAKDPSKSSEGFKKGSLSIDFFAARAKTMDSRHGMFVFDSCFSGTVFKSLRSIPDFRSEMLAKPAKEFIASGSENQQVPDDSVFRRRFVDGINGYADSNGDGLVTGSELGQFVQTEVSGFSAGTQTPVYGKLAGNDGEFLFFTGKTQQTVTATAASGEREQLLAVIRRSPGSVEANTAMKRLREIDDTLKNQPPVIAPERKDKVTTVTSTVIYKNPDTDYPYVIIAPVTAYADGKRITAAFSVQASNFSSYKNLLNRKEMLRSVMGHKIEDAGIKSSDSMTDVRLKIKDAAVRAMKFACPGCAKGDIALKGLMIK